MIHGGAASVGCIAIGNDAIEEVFALAKASRYQDWEVILAPTDLRKTKQKAEGWVVDLYKKIEKRLRELPAS
jgi:sialic acid synthase SpsE